MPSRFHKRAASGRAAAIEALEERVVFGVYQNGDFIIAPPGGGQAHETIKLHPAQGVIGLRTADAMSKDVVNWESTGTHESTPGDHGGPHQFA